jgi:iron complex outermembrane receptor protein
MNNKTLPLLLLLFISITSGIKAQNHCKGVVKDAEGKPLEYVAVMLTNVADSNQFIGTATDSEGKFEFSNFNYQSYFVTASVVGYTNGTSGIIEAGHTDTLTIVLTQATTEINEFTFQSKVNRIVMEPGKIIMNVENSTMATGNTALDLLRRMPGVFVDNDGNISVKGKSGVNVYIDGRPTYLSGSQLKNFLKTLMASNISKIEVITQPGANYDAEGNAGIINITLIKKMALGFNGNVEGWYIQGIYPKGGGSFSFNYGKGKWNIFGSYSYSNWHGIIKPHLERRIDSTFYVQDYNGQPIENNHNVKLNIDYDISKKVVFGTGINFSAGHSQWRGANTSTFTNLNTGVVDSTQIVADGTYWTNYSVTLNLNTMWKIDSLGQKFTVNADGGTYLEYVKGDYQYKFLDQWGNVFRTQADRNYNQSPALYLVSGKVDYENPHVFKKLKLETGIKSSYVTNEANVQYRTFDAGNNPIPIAGMSNHFIYIENINAIYLSLKYNVKKWSFSAGLRGEHTNTTGHQITTGQINRQNYFSLFPSAGIAWNPSDNHSVNFMYSRRIDRPSYSQLNPFIYTMDNYSSFQGNPNLLPQFSNNVELSYTMFQVFTMTASYAQINNNLTDIFRVDSLNSQRLIYTNVNLGQTHNFTAGGTLMMPIGKWLYFMVTGNAIYNSVVDTSFNINRQGWYGMFNGYFEFTLPAKFTIELNGWAMTNQINGQSVTLPCGEIGLGVSKKLFKEQLTLKVGLTDIFRTTPFRSTITTQDGQSVYNVFSWDSRRFTFSASFKFGKAIKKQNQKEKDDLFNRVGGGR